VTAPPLRTEAIFAERTHCIRRNLDPGTPGVAVAHVKATAGRHSTLAWQMPQRSLDRVAHEAQPALVTLKDVFDEDRLRGLDGRVHGLQGYKPTLAD